MPREPIYFYSVSKAGNTDPLGSQWTGRIVSSQSRSRCGSTQRWRWDAHGGGGGGGVAGGGR